jgi:hypothetical protein
MTGAAAAVLVLSSSSLALADSVVVGPDVTRAPGETGSFVVGLVAENGADPINSCNANGGNPVTVSFTSSSAGVVAAPGKIQIDGCDDPATPGVVENAVTVTYVVADTAENGSTATIGASASGGRGIGNPKVYGTFNPGSITVSVATPLPPDSTPPRITPIITGTVGQHDWYTSDVTVTWSVSDAEGPVLSTNGCYPVTVTQDTASRTLACTATSAGGTATESVTIKRDATKPTFSCAQPSSDWSATDAVIPCSSRDATSGLAGAGDEFFELTTSVGSGEETDNAFTGSHDISDQAGNTVTAGPVGGNKVDKKAPTVTWSSGAGQDFYFGDQVTPPTCTAVDGGSGLAGACSVSGFSTSVGTHTMTASATDNVGNVGFSTSTYTVKAWTLDGFYSPVDMSRLNTVKAGATVPLKFDVFKGSERLTSNIGATFSARKATCGTDAAADAVEEFTTTGSTTLRYDSTSQQWIQNWATPRNGAGSCYRVTMTAADGSSISADFRLR